MLEIAGRLTIALALGASALAFATVTDTRPTVEAACTINTTLRPGAKNAQVACLEQTLRANGLQSTWIDDYFGTVTRTTIINYQRANGLYVDGVVGRQTARSLGIWATTATPTPAPSPGPSPSCSINTTLRPGAKNAQVACLEQTLRANGLQSTWIDDYFGTVTRTTIINYQRANGLYVDGVVGRQTARSLGIWATAAPTCRPSVSVPGDAQTVVNVNARDSNRSTADLTLMTRTSSGWSCSSTMYARLGANGVTPVQQRVAGSRTTPSGVFGLGTMTSPTTGNSFQFFGNGSNPGVRGQWHQVRTNDCWWLEPGTSDYNTLVSKSAAQCYGPNNEYLPDYVGSYSQAALIGANMGPVRSGDDPGETARAGAIFLHAHSYTSTGNTRPTAGCVSLSSTNLAWVLTRLDPAATYFVITS